MAPSPPRPKAAAIDITVETLTGAGFRLRVSSHETVMSVKARIMRIEGVSISQQHLIHRNRELPDSATLHDSGVRSGAKIQLVVAMRGGPVNTRRLPIYEDITHAEMQQLIDMHSDASLDGVEDARQGRQVTLLVFREGDQVSFYRVIENRDGSYSPLSDSWGSTLRNMFHEESTDDMKRRLDENTATMSKMSELKRKMQLAQTKKRDRLRRPSSRPLRTGSGAAGSSTAASSSRRVRLPPVSTPTVRGSASFPPASLPGTDLSESFSRLAAGMGPLSRHGAPPSRGRRTSSPSGNADVEVRALASRGNIVSGSQRRRKLSLSESAELYKQLQSQRGLAPNSTPINTSSVAAPRDYGAYRRTLARLTRYPSQPEVPSGGENSVELPILFERDERKGSMMPRMSVLPSSAHTHTLHQNNKVLTETRRPRTSPPQQQQLYSKDDLDRPGSAAANLKPTDTKVRQLCRILSANAVLTSTRRRGKTGSSATSKIVSAANSAYLKTGEGNNAKGDRDGTEPKITPALTSRRATAAPKRPRCQLCRRRLGLAGVYRCYCAGVFCGQHRYPELHHCGYDFKTEGRKLLQRANPLVTAAKLPKI